MRPLSLEDIRAWLDKAMAGLTQHWGFPLGLDTFTESFQQRFLGSSGEKCFSVDLHSWGYVLVAVGCSRRGTALVNELML